MLNSKAPDEVWLPYTMWEDWVHGMYGRSRDVEHVDAALSLLSDPVEFGVALVEVSQRWPNATKHNLSKVTLNHQPWCGRAAACLRYGTNVQECNEAWGKLTADQRLEANAVADRFTFSWRQAWMTGQMRLTI